MTTNSQLSKSEHIKQKQKQTKQTTRTGIESLKWIDHIEGYQWEEGGGRIGEKSQGTGNINCKYKTDRASLRIV